MKFNTIDDFIVFDYRFENFYMEYVTFMVYGYSIASFFLPFLIEPIDASGVLTTEGQEEYKKTSYTRGGDVLIREMHEQIMEIYKMYKKFNLKLEDIQLSL